MLAQNNNSISNNKTIVISNVSVELNGTRVDCSYGGSLMSETFVSVIKNGMNQLYYQNRATHITASTYYIIIIVLSASSQYLM